MIVEPDFLWGDDIGIYSNEYKQREIPVTLHYFKNGVNTSFEIDAGARIGGLNIWTKPQKPFTIYILEAGLEKMLSIINYLKINRLLIFPGLYLETVAMIGKRPLFVIQ